MEKITSCFFKHFEKILVLSILLIIVLINFFVPYKIGFLNFFYLPIIIAGYFLGRRMAVLTAFLCILVVIIFILISPSLFFTAGTENIYVIVSLIGWGSFLILTSAAISKGKCISFYEIASLRSQLHFCLQYHYQKSYLITEHKGQAAFFREEGQSLSFLTKGLKGTVPPSSIDKAACPLFVYSFRLYYWENIVRKNT